MSQLDSEWRKGVTLSDKTARGEYGLTQDEMVGAGESAERAEDADRRAGEAEGAVDRQLDK